MGRVETMLLSFCTKEGWTLKDSGTRVRCALRLYHAGIDGINVLVVRPSVWSCIYRRHPDVMHEARGRTRTVERLLHQFEAEDAAANAMHAIDQVLKGVIHWDHKRTHEVCELKAHQ